MVCYLPGTGTFAVIGLAVYIIWHNAITHFLGVVGTATEIALVFGAEATVAIALIWTARVIRRRRAQAGACTACRFRCQEALQGRPNLLVNRVDRRITPPAPARPAALTCHPAAPPLGRRARPPARPPPAPRPRPYPSPLRRPRVRPPAPLRPSPRPRLPVPSRLPTGPWPLARPLPRANPGPSLPATRCANRHRAAPAKRSTSTATCSPPTEWTPSPPPPPKPLSDRAPRRGTSPGRRRLHEPGGPAGGRSLGPRPGPAEVDSLARLGLHSESAKEA